MTNDRIPELVLGELDTERMELDNGHYAMRSKGLIRLYLKDNRELFSVDSSTFPFDYKILTGALQIYLLGFQNGRVQERTNCKTRIITAINLALET